MFVSVYKCTHVNFPNSLTSLRCGLSLSLSPTLPLSRSFSLLLSLSCYRLVCTRLSRNYRRAAVICDSPWRVCVCVCLCVYVCSCVRKVFIFKYVCIDTFIDMYVCDALLGCISFSGIGWIKYRRTSHRLFYSLDFCVFIKNSAPRALHPCHFSSRIFQINVHAVPTTPHSHTPYPTPLIYIYIWTYMCFCLYVCV